LVFYQVEDSSRVKTYGVLPEKRNIEPLLETYDQIQFSPPEL